MVDHLHGSHGELYEEGLEDTLECPQCQKPIVGKQRFCSTQCQAQYSNVRAFWQLLGWLFVCLLIALYWLFFPHAGQWVGALL